MVAHEAKFNFVCKMPNCGKQNEFTETVHDTERHKVLTMNTKGIYDVRCRFCDAQHSVRES